MLRLTLGLCALLAIACGILGWKLDRTMSSLSVAKEKADAATAIEKGYADVVDRYKASLAECRDLVERKTSDIRALQSYIEGQKQIIERNEEDKRRDQEIINSDEECADWGNDRICRAIDERLRKEDSEDSGGSK